ncbi:MAG: acyl carrier protein [Lachnospiraceae bacterium]|nr:acyl carrier protein [Lachnospiraceae bacterium]
MDGVIEILEELRPDVDFTAEKELVTARVLTSFDLISLVGELNETYDIDISAVDLIPSNFDSAEAIAALVRRKQEE